MTADSPPPVEQFTRSHFAQQFSVALFRLLASALTGCSLYQFIE
jgi:hypothetical protein